LGSTKTLLRFFEQTRITHSPSVAPRHERQQPDIKANRLIVRWQWFRLYHATETGIPHAVLTFEAESFNLAFDRTVQLNLDVANLFAASVDKYRGFLAFVPRAATTPSPIRKPDSNCVAACR
jgi:hypothetical protein